MGASLVVEGSTNATVFETYLEEVLLPTLKRGQVVVMDNLSAHKAEGQGSDRGSGMRAHPPATLLAGLQSHRAQAFSKLKSYLRDACARSRQMLMEVIGEALSTNSASDAEGFFEHCGYRAVVQSL
jgi:hypothetical protein